MLYHSSQHYCMMEVQRIHNAARVMSAMLGLIMLPCTVPLSLVLVKVLTSSPDLLNKWWHIFVFTTRRKWHANYMKDNEG